MNWIATRFLFSRDGVSSVQVHIGVPEQDDPDTWRCQFGLNLDGAEQLEYAYGLDAFQSLLMALTGIRVHLDALQSKPSWEWTLPGDEGDHGFPVFVPQSFGLAFSKKIESLIEHEIEKLSPQA